VVAGPATTIAEHDRQQIRPRCKGGLFVFGALIVSTRISLIGRTVAASARHPWVVLLLAGALTLAALVFTAKNFAMTTRYHAGGSQNGSTGGKERSPSTLLFLS